MRHAPAGCHILHNDNDTHHHLQCHAVQPYIIHTECGCMPITKKAHAWEASRGWTWLARWARSATPKGPPPVNSPGRPPPVFVNTTSSVRPGLFMLLVCRPALALLSSKLCQKGLVQCCAHVCSCPSNGRGHMLLAVPRPARHGIAAHRMQQSSRPHPVAGHATLLPLQRARYWRLLAQPDCASGRGSKHWGGGGWESTIACSHSIMGCEHMHV